MEDGQVIDIPIADGEGLIVDTTPHDDLARLASEVPAPVPSMNSAVGVRTTGKVELRDCQSWVRQVVAKLVDEELLPNKAIHAVSSVPQY